MNTGLRRFFLRLIVGLLTFAIGVGAAILLGGFTPFRSYAGTSQPRYRGCDYHRHSRLYADETPGAEPWALLLKGPRGIRMHPKLRELPTVPPVAEAPAPPTPLEDR